MNKLIQISFFVLLFLALTGNTLYAQFINLQLKVEPELTASVERELNFGELITNSGETYIELGDLNMGIFSIRALNTQNLYISLDAPDYLYPEATTLNDDRIPLDLRISINNTDTNNPDNSVELIENEGYIPVFDQQFGSEPNDDVWKEMYIYIYGSVFVENIASGEYSGQVNLVIEYD